MTKGRGALLGQGDQRRPPEKETFKLRATRRSHCAKIRDRAFQAAQLVQRPKGRSNVRTAETGPGRAGEAASVAGAGQTIQEQAAQNEVREVGWAL